MLTLVVINLNTVLNYNANMPTVHVQCTMKFFYGSLYRGNFLLSQLSPVMFLVSYTGYLVVYAM